jgi:hypothetical protein
MSVFLEQEEKEQYRLGSNFVDGFLYELEMQPDGHEMEARYNSTIYRDGERWVRAFVTRDGTVLRSEAIHRIHLT